MAKQKFSLARRDREMDELVARADHRTLGVWAADCAEHVLHYFEEQLPDDARPRHAIETLRDWVRTGIFSMAVIRRASLDSHAAAREVGEDNAARSAARAAGQAVATAHVRTHAPGGAIYGLQAIHRATDEAGVEAAMAREREWQLQRLRDLIAERGAMPDAEMEP